MRGRTAGGARGRAVGALTLALLLLAGLAGCGESSSSSASSSSASAPAAASSAAVSNRSAAKVVAGACGGGKRCAKSSYEHWLSVEQALGGDANAGHRALGFLLTADWLVGEASAQHVSVSTAEAKQRLATLKQQSFPQAGALQKFLAKAHETEADLLERVKIELLESGIAAKVTAGQSATQRKATLASFQQAFQRRWRARTTCKAGYVMEDCSEYRGKPENLAVASSASSTRSSSVHSSSAGSKSSSASGSSAASASSGEVSASPGAMEISSPAFERNGAIPTQYTCDGANISPPLEWQKVQSKAAALVLFVIDDSATGPASGIRWIVGDIGPSSVGVAAGKTPEGGIVGSDTQGHSGYGG